MPGTVVVADSLPHTALSELEGYALRHCDGRDPRALREALADAEAVLIRSGTRIDAAALAAAPRLRIVARAGVGLDNVDVAAATRAGVVVANAPRSNVISVAELAVGLIIASVRRVLPANRSLRDGRWERSRYQGRELAGTTVGIIGLGHVGTLVAERLAPFGVRLLAHDPYVDTEAADRLGARAVALDTLLSESDTVTVHVPKTPATIGLLGDRELRLMKPSAHLVNTSRGGIVDETALTAALTQGRLAGAALDVFALEPAVGNALLVLDSVVATPHIGASTHEAQERAGREAVTAVRCALEGRPVPYAVNTPLAAPVPAEPVGGGPV
ncbi:hydroxyacid dehydrogenase [Streptomyces pharetrae]|uniref:hydroxyacid dehydrogenase n=1 Tax=Streptomyces pharetrae TaxID=291370 RepID=UPI0036493906